MKYCLYHSGAGQSDLWSTSIAIRLYLANPSPLLPSHMILMPFLQHRIVIYWSGGESGFSNGRLLQNWAGIWLLSRNFWHGIAMLLHCNWTGNVNISSLGRLHNITKHWHCLMDSVTFRSRHHQVGSAKIRSLFWMHSTRRNLSCLFHSKFWI